jgi:hypothetical protein
MRRTPAAVATCCASLLMDTRQHSFWTGPEPKFPCRWRQLGEQPGFGPTRRAAATKQTWPSRMVSVRWVVICAMAAYRFSATGQRVALARDRSLRACHGPEKLQVRLLRALSLPAAHRSRLARHPRAAVDSALRSSRRGRRSRLPALQVGGHAVVLPARAVTGRGSHRAPNDHWWGPTLGEGPSFWLRACRRA